MYPLTSRYPLPLDHIIDSLRDSNQDCGLILEADADSLFVMLRLSSAAIRQNANLIRAILEQAERADGGQA